MRVTALISLYSLVLFSAFPASVQADPGPGEMAAAVPSTSAPASTLKTGAAASAADPAPSPADPAPSPADPAPSSSDPAVAPAADPTLPLEPIAPADPAIPAELATAGDGTVASSNSLPPAAATSPSNLPPSVTPGPFTLGNVGTPQTIPPLAPESATESASKTNDAFHLGNDTPQPLPPAPTGTALPWYDRLFDQQLPVKIGLTVGETYSDNIYFQESKTSDYITNISPFVSFRLGRAVPLYPTLDEETIYDQTDSGDINYLSVDYRPTITLYERNSKLNVVDEFANVLYAHRFGKLTLSLQQKYEKLSQPTVQENAVGVLIHRDIFTTTARASYVYSDKLSAYGTIDQVISKYKTDLYTNSNEWTGDAYFLYQLLPKLSVGVGPSIGFVDIARGPNQTYQRALVHLIYPATSKFSTLVNFGGEVRENEHNASPTRVTPVLEAEAVYKPFDSMTLTLNATRHTIVSNDQLGENYDATTVSAQVRQRFLQVVYFSIFSGFEKDQYIGGSQSSGSSRDDEIYFTGAGVNWNSKDWLSIGGSYQYIEDDSTIKFLSFNNNQFTVTVTVKY